MAVTPVVTDDPVSHLIENDLSLVAATGDPTLRPLGDYLANSTYSNGVNVRQYGANGDGVTNDAPAFQAAVNSVASGAYIKIFVPSGSYLLNSNVTANGRVVSWSIDPGAMFSGAGKITPQSAGDFATLDDVAHMYGYYQQGTPTAPRTNKNPMVSLVGHINSAGIAANCPQSPLYVAAYKYDPTAIVGRATSIFCETIDPIGGGFVEGIRAHAFSTSPTGACNLTAANLYTACLSAGAAAAPATGVFSIGCESVVDWVNAAATDAPVTTQFSKLGFLANYMADGSVSVKSDALFLGNPWAQKPARAGVLLGLGSVDDTAFASQAHTVWGLDLAGGGGTQSFAAIRIPNNTPIVAVNAAVSANVNIMYVNTSDYLVIGQDCNTKISKGLIVGAPAVGFRGDGTINMASNLYINGVQVIAPRDTGWTAMTGTLDKATAYATSTVTLAQLAGRVAQLQATLTTHGLIGA